MLRLITCHDYRHCLQLTILLPDLRRGSVDFHLPVCIICPALRPVAICMPGVVHLYT
jgi:hypothetical protein